MKARPVRHWSKDFTPKPREKRRQLHIDKVPAGLHAAYKAKAKREGVSIRSLVLTFLQDWSDTKTAGAR